MPGLKQGMFCAVEWVSEDTYSVVPTKDVLKKVCLVDPTVIGEIKYGNQQFPGRVMGTFNTKKEADLFLDNGKLKVSKN
ncbi:unnamed protein product, partial [Cyprideis torosa]